MNNTLSINDAFKQLSAKLNQQYDSREAENISKILFEDLLGIRRIESEDQLSVSQRKILEKASLELQTNKPIQYITGLSHFYGYVFQVNENVLIPRPETEELVFYALEYLKKNRPYAKILDIGTGSGCIPISLKKQLNSLQVQAVDISEGALAIAKKNAQKLKTEVAFLKLDFLSQEEWKRLGNYDLIISNPPYIPVNEKKLMAANVLDFEPHLALFVEDTNPLLFYERIAAFAQMHLNLQGYLFLEINQYNADLVKRLYLDNGFQEVNLLSDMSGNPRIIIAKKAP